MDSQVTREVPTPAAPPYTPSTPRYHGIEVQLSGEDGNAFAIMGAVSAALRRGGVVQAEREAFVDEAYRGDYDHLLQTCMRWVNVE